jgi:hypothetical protein
MAKPEYVPSNVDYGHSKKGGSGVKDRTFLGAEKGFVGDLCFDACFSQLEPKPPSGGQEKKKGFEAKDRRRSPLAQEMKRVIT